MSREDKSNADGKTLEQLAGQRSTGFLADMWDFLTHNKKWWLTPIIIVLLLLALLIVLGGSAAAPFIYALF